MSNWVIPIFKILGWWGWTLTWFYLLFEEHIKYWWWTTFFFFFQKRFFCVPCSWKSFFARENESKPASKDQSEQHTVFTLVKAEMRQTFYRHTRRVEESKVMPKKNPGDFSFWHIWCLYCILMYKNRTSFTIKHTVWKLLKMSHLIFLILAFSPIFGPIQADLSGNTVWPQASGFQKLAKMDHFWPF